MLDTAVKDGASTFAALGEDGVAAFLAAARALGLVTALAGALGPADLERAARLGADIVGVRGSACEGGRAGTVSAARVRALRAALALGAGVSPALSYGQVAATCFSDVTFSRWLRLSAPFILAVPLQVTDETPLVVGRRMLIAPVHRRRCPVPDEIHLHVGRLLAGQRAPYQDLHLAANVLRELQVCGRVHDASDSVPWSASVSW